MSRHIDDEHDVHTLETVEEYVYRLAEHMGLNGWSFRVDEEHASKDALAEITCTYGQRHAVVSLCEGWLDLTPEEQRGTLVHELLHAHLAPLRHLLDDLFKVSGRKGGAYSIAACNLQEEYIVEAIAQAWSLSLPLPSSKRKKRK